MRPRLLELTAFGPYASTVRIDFDELARDGLFLVHGPTGSGKTSILDGMTYALYGGVAGTRRHDRLRSDHADPRTATAVAFEFCLQGSDYRITRTPAHERAKKSGTGMTSQKPKATLSVRRDGVWEPVAQGVEDVGIQVADLLGLNRDQFQQVVVLPQGAFATALHADARQRRDLLSSLFRTGRFDDYTQSLALRAKRAEDAALEAAADLARLQTQARDRWLVIAGDDEPPATTTALAELALAAAEDARTVVRLAADVEQAAGEALHEARLDAQRRQRVTAARDVLSQLDDAAPELSDARARVDAAQRAQPLTDFVARAEEAAGAVDRATSDRQAAVDVLRHRTPTTSAPLEAAARRALEAAQACPLDVDAVDAARDGLHAIVVRLTLVGTRFQQAQAAARSAVEHAAVAASHRLAADTAAQDLDGLHQRRDALALRRAATAATADRVQDLRDEHARLERVADAVEAVVRLQARCHDLAADRVALTAALNTALDRQRRLLEQRIEGMAAELAADLRDGSPCSVCGAVSHPAPAQPALDAVPAAALEGAQADVDVARRDVAAHDDRETAVRSDLHAALAVAGGESDDPHGVRERLEAVAAERAKAEAARDSTSTLDADLTAVEAEITTTGHEVTTRTQAAITADAAAQACEATARQLAVEIETEAGVAGDPAGVLVSAQAAAGAADALAAAARAEQRLRDEAAAARLRLDAMLARHGFDGPQQVSAAMLPDDRLQDLRQQLADADRRRAAAEATVAAEEVADDDEEPVEDLHQAHAAADQALADAQVRLGAVAQAADDLQRLTEQFRDADARHGCVVAQAQRLRRLADICSGTGNEQRMSLERYVLAAYFEEITEEASQRLLTMTGGRYTLRHSDARVRGGGASGLSITVLDAYTGTQREVGSLSGGETFQASLCLALAVAEVVQRHAGGVHLDMLFIDEGFGALDADSLEQAMVELDALREGGRLIGVISHVPALRERINAGIVVEKTSSGSDARVVALTEA